MGGRAINEGTEGVEDVASIEKKTACMLRRKIQRIATVCTSASGAVEGEAGLRINRQPTLTDPECVPSLD